MSMTARSKTEIEIETARGILTSAQIAIASMEDCWPKYKRSSNAQRELDSVKDKIATAIVCLDDAIGEMES